jgi:hypothetical protein
MSLIPLVCLGGRLLSQDRDQPRIMASSSAVRSTVILGLDGVSSNTSGELSLRDDALVFGRPEVPVVRIPINSISAVFLSQEDKEVGGTPMALGRAAAPFGSGRVIGLLAHKKYDFLTIEYHDAKGGLHAVICQLSKDQGLSFANDIEVKGTHVIREVSHESK